MSFGVPSHVSDKKLPHAFDKSLLLGGTFRMPLDTYIARKGQGVSVPNAFNKSVRGLSPRLKIRCESVDALVMV